MATGGLDSFLNFAVPVAVILFFGFTIYKPLKPQIDGFFAWVGQTFRNTMEAQESNTTGYKSVIVYE